MYPHKILPNQQQQRLITKFKICSSLVGSNILHSSVVPVKAFWLFDLRWNLKLRNQPVFGLHLTIPSVSCPFNHFVPYDVKEANNLMLVFLVGCESWKTKARNQYTKPLGSQNGEDVNQLLLKFQSLRMGELWCNSVFVLYLL